MTQKKPKFAEGDAVLLDGTPFTVVGFWEDPESEYVEYIIRPLRERSDAEDLIATETELKAAP